MIFQYNSNFELVGEYQTVEEAANSVDRCWGAVYNCVSKKHITSAGFYWYKGETSLNNPAEYFTSLIYDRPRLSFKVFQYDLDFKLVGEYSSSEQAAKSVNRNQNSIIKCLDKKRITCAGFYWYRGKAALNNPEWYFKDLIENRKKQIPERTDIPKRVAQCNQDGDVIKVFDSIKAAARAFNIDKKGIRETLKGNQQTCCGFKWRLFE